MLQGWRTLPRLDVGDEHVDPAERLQLAGFPLAEDDGAVGSDLGAGGVEPGAALGDQVRAEV